MEDLSHYYMNGNPIFPSSIPQPQPQPQPPRDLHYAMVMLGGGGGISFRSDSTVGMASATSGTLGGDSSGGGGNGLDMEIGVCSGRWLREETLTLLQIRSRLDSKFKETNQKGPLWDEVSRIMSVDHGYKRTGKKCCEKFENLYKYYKKVKEGKAGKQDKKHYRFFRHLEALYGETSTSNPPSISNLNVGTHTFQANQHDQPNNPSVFEAGDYENHNATVPPFKKDSDCAERMINKRRLGKKCWKTMIIDSIETKVQTLMEKQEAWMVKMMKTIDEKEKERISKEEQWRKEEAARFEIESKVRANERAWMESRDSALMEALLKLTEKESTLQATSPEYYFCNDHNQNDHKYDKIGNSTVSNLSSHHNYIFHQPDERDLALNDLHNDGGYRVLMSDHPEKLWDYYGTKIAKGDDHEALRRVL